MNPSLVLVFVSAALTAYAIVRIVAPFFESEEDQFQQELLDDEMQKIEQLVAEKGVLLQSLRDIEFDHNTGKLSDEDYERLRKRYEREAVDVMRRLDEVRGGVDLDDEIDEQLKARLEERPGEFDADETTESAGASTDPSGPIECPECGTELEPEARFCSRCGTPLEEVSSEANSVQQSSEDARGESRAEDGEVEGPAGTDPDEPVGSELRSEPTG